MTDAYIRDLERAVRDLPRPIADEIVSGVREELRGLDAAAAAERITELGDPTFIAASARGELPVRADQPWYTVLTIVLLAIGGFIVPVLGWLVGLVMLWYSRTWVLRDKIIGTLLLPVVAAIVVGISWVVRVTTPATVVDGEEAINPLIPAAYDITHSSILATVFIVPVITTIYLAVRARRLRSIQQP